MTWHTLTGRDAVFPRHGQRVVVRGIDVHSRLFEWKGKVVMHKADGVVIEWDHGTTESWPYVGCGTMRQERFARVNMWG